MTQIKPLLASLTAQVLLLLAVATIRIMQRLYRNKLISKRTTEWFFRTAKRVEHCADRLAAR